MALQKKAIGSKVYFIDRSQGLLFTFRETEKARERYKVEKGKALASKIGEPQ